ncbi:MAG: 2-phospho-L-lactate transferase, partial [Rothia mucilaginosa]
MSTHSTSYDTQGIPRLPALPTQALRLLKTTHRSPKVTAMGGGHGLYGSLSALRHVTPDLTAVVTVADDGGSSGRLREEMGILPPGDLRMALSALCDDTDWGRTWRDVMQHRFSAPEGYEGEFPLDYHALGNLLIAPLWQLLDDPVAGLDWAGALLNARGRVLPMALDPMVIYGTVLREHNGGGIERVKVVGQVNLSKEERVHDIGLTPEN